MPDDALWACAVIRKAAAQQHLLQRASLIYRQADLHRTAWLRAGATDPPVSRRPRTPKLHPHKRLLPRLRARPYDPCRPALRTTVPSSPPAPCAARWRTLRTTFSAAPASSSSTRPSSRPQTARAQGRCSRCVYARARECVCVRACSCVCAHMHRCACCGHPGALSPLDGRDAVRHEGEA
jgi:hypothetical protein